MTYWLTGVTGNTYNLPTPPTAWVKRCLTHKYPKSYFNIVKTKIRKNWLHTLFNVNLSRSLGRISKGSNKTLLRWSCPVWRTVWTGTAASKRLFPPKSARGSPAAACSRTTRQSTSTWLSPTILIHSCDHKGASSSRLWAARNTAPFLWTALATQALTVEQLGNTKAFKKKKKQKRLKV